MWVALSGPGSPRPPQDAAPGAGWRHDIDDPQPHPTLPLRPGTWTLDPLHSTSASRSAPRHLQGARDVLDFDVTVAVVRRSQRPPSRRWSTASIDTGNQIATTTVRSGDLLDARAADDGLPVDVDHGRRRRVGARGRAHDRRVTPPDHARRRARRTAAEHPATVATMPGFESRRAAPQGLRVDFARCSSRPRPAHQIELDLRSSSDR